MSDSVNGPLLIVVEGENDICFLKAISSILSPDHDVPNLSQHPGVMFLPTGGSNLKDWMARIIRLGKRAFYLFDREQEPETSQRKRIVATINDVPGSVAVMTSKRTVENYIHPAAMQQACGMELKFDDDTDVAGFLALELMWRSHGNVSWSDLPYKRQRRLHEKAKKILNRRAVHFMTPALVAEQDRDGEIDNWLHTIGQMIVAVK